MPLDRGPNENKEVFAVKGISQHLYLPRLSVIAGVKRNIAHLCVCLQVRKAVAGSIRTEGEQLGRAIIGQAQWTSRRYAWLILYLPSPI